MPERQHPQSPEPGRSGGGGFEMPWPGNTRQQPGGSSGEPDFRTGGGIGLPRAELPPQGGFPMPPMPPSPDAGGMESDGRGSGGFPFPLPGPGGGGNNPYGDLSDILRRRGSGTTAAVGGGGGLWRLVRSLLGGVLGFGGRGIFGWIIRLLVVRFGWGFLQRILGRVLMGR